MGQGGRQPRGQNKSVISRDCGLRIEVTSQSFHVKKARLSSFFHPLFPSLGRCGLIELNTRELPPSLAVLTRSRLELQEESTSY
jgi:hypothetical protein